MVNTTWQLFAAAVVVVAFAAVLWDGFLRGTRGASSLVAAAIGIGLVGAGAFVLAAGEPWGWLLVLAAGGAQALGRRVDDRT